MDSPLQDRTKNWGMLLFCVCQDAFSPKCFTNRDAGNPIINTHIIHTSYHLDSHLKLPLQGELGWTIIWEEEKKMFTLRIYYRVSNVPFFCFFFWILDVQLCPQRSEYPILFNNIFVNMFWRDKGLVSMWVPFEFGFVSKVCLVFSLE